MIGSVANYLAELRLAARPADALRRRPRRSTRPSAPRCSRPTSCPPSRAAQIAEHGAELPSRRRAHDGLLALVELQNGDAAPSYVAGTTNFYAVTRYNWSSYYAMAVIALEAIAAR